MPFRNLTRAVELVLLLGVCMISQCLSFAILRPLSLMFVDESESEVECEIAVVALAGRGKVSVPVCVCVCARV